MKIFKNEFEYREWMVKDYLHLDENYPPIFEPDEIERVILDQMPREFPCIVRLEKGDDVHGPDAVKYFYRAEVQVWAKLFGIVN